MRLKVFISRSRDEAIDFITRLPDQVKDVHAESLIEFSPLAFQDIPSCDWIFFYSKRGIRYFFDQFAKSTMQLDPKIKFAAFGEQSSAFLNHYVRNIDFVGSSNSNSTAQNFLKIAEGQEVLFVKGVNSLDSLKSILTNHLAYKELVVYNNIPKQHAQLGDYDILVFTSPMNLRTYFKINPIKENQTIYVIGASTASAALQSGIEKFYVSPSPSLSSLADMISEHISRME